MVKYREDDARMFGKSAEKHEREEIELEEGGEA